MSWRTTTQCQWLCSLHFHHSSDMLLAYLLRSQQSRWSNHVICAPKPDNAPTGAGPWDWRYWCVWGNHEMKGRIACWCWKSLVGLPSRVGAVAWPKEPWCVSSLGPQSCPPQSQLSCLLLCSVAWSRDAYGCNSDHIKSPQWPIPVHGPWQSGGGDPFAPFTHHHVLQI